MISLQLLAGNGRERFMIEFKFIKKGLFFKVMLDFLPIVYYHYTNKQIQRKDFSISLY